MADGDRTKPLPFPTWEERRQWKGRPGRQTPLTGFPRPAGMDEARQALNAAERPVYGPERPPGDLSLIQRRQFRSERS